jgi:copper(I)-binding protein
VGALEISHPWARATKPGAKVAGGFVEITNTGTEADRLVAVSSGVSPVMQLHTMTMENNVMKMVEVAEGMEIKPGETLVLKPRSLHIMFMDLQKPLVEKDMVEVELTFAKAGSVKVEFMVQDGEGGMHH